MRLTNSVKPPHDSYYSNAPDQDLDDTPRISGSHFGSEFHNPLVRDLRHTTSAHHHGFSPRVDRRSNRDERRSASGSGSSSDDNECRSDNHRDSRPSWRESLTIDHDYRGRTLPSYFAPHPPYAPSPVFGGPRYPSQSWGHPPSTPSGDHGVTTAPLEFRDVQRGFLGDRNTRIPGYNSNEYGHHDVPRTMAGIQAYYPYPHPDYMRLPAPLGTLQGRSGSMSATQRVPPRLRTSQACEKCRKRKVKCTGDRPACGRCTIRGFICEYAISEKDDKDKSPFLRGSHKARQERRMRSLGQESTMATHTTRTSFDNDSQSDRRPSDSSTSSDDSIGVDIGHAQHEERRYLADPYAPSGSMGYATVHSFGSNEQPPYRRLSVKDLLNPRPATPLNGLYPNDNTAHPVFQIVPQGGLESNELGSQHERKVAEFPSTSPRITPNRLPVMVASEATDTSLDAEAHSLSGDESVTRPGSSPQARDSPFSPPPPSSISGSLARFGQGTRSADNVSGNNPGVRGDSHTMRGKDHQESDSSMSSHDPSPISEIGSE